MHGRFDRSDETTDKSIHRSWGIGIVVLPIALVAFLVGLAITKPDVSRWISEAEQAEFVASGQAMGGIPAEAQQPAPQMTHRQGLLTPEAKGPAGLAVKSAIFRR